MKHVGASTSLIPAVGAVATTTNRASLRMVLNVDPTRTGLERAAYLRELTARMMDLRREVVKYVGTEDEFALAPRVPGLVGNRRKWEFATDDQKAEEFNKWLQQQIDSKVLGVGRGENAWNARYVQSAYRKGAVRAYTDSKRLQYSKNPEFYSKSMAEFLQSSFAAPETKSKIRLLATRNFEDLKGITSSMSADMNRIFADAVANGKGPRVVERELTARIDGMTRGRAATMARTEIVHAHAEGQLDSFEALNVSHVGVMAEWMTAEDGKVCPQCAALNRMVLTIKEARGLIPRHPNCRCAWIPADVGEKQSGQKRTADRIRKALVKSAKAETGRKGEEGARRESRWAGASRRIATKRPKA